ncbi:MAG TPA: YfhO family protein, partial [Methylomirabilota bacterium]|nr:YfhO family protein [Methylomirabilota bacterium]
MKRALLVAGAFALLAVARFWFVIHPDRARRLFLPGDFGLGVEGFFYHHLKRGVMPLWDTTLGTGTLFVGGGTHQPTYTIAHLHLFYPLNLLFLGLAERGQTIPILALHVQHVVHYALAGCFAYAYGRSLALSVPAAFVVGLVYAFSGFFASHVSHWTMIDTATWLPLVLLLGRRAMEGRTTAAVGGGLALGAALLAGYPAYVLLTGLALGLMALWLVAWRFHDAGGRGVGGLVGRLALLGLVGSGVAAIQLVPSWQSATTSGQALGDFAFKATGSLPPAALAGLLMPFPLRSLAWWRSNTSEYYVYAGALTLVLVAAALWRVRTRAVGFHALLGGIGVALALGAHLELFRLLVDLAPGFGYFRYPSRSVLLLSLALATLAGFGLDALRAATDPREFGALAGALRRVLVVGLLALLLTLGALVA